MSQHYKYVIIGAGPTGLGAACRLNELGINDFIILEKDTKAGGLSSSFVDDSGFTWDIGGHVQFSHYKYFDDLMIKALGKEGWLNHQRESWVWIRDRFVPYPFQNNIRHLPKEEMWKCLQGIIQEYKSPTQAKPANFKEWIYATLGAGIAEVFMVPYNFKVWAYPPETMNYTWIGERVAVTDLERVSKNILFDLEDISWGPNSTFQFPKYGGTGAIWLSVADIIGPDKFHFNTTVNSIDNHKKIIHCADNTEYTYDAIINTMPLDILVNSLHHISDEYKELVKLLKHSSTHIIGVGLKGKPKENLKTKCWMYFPESNCPFYRVTVFSNYSPNNVPDISQHWSLMAEVSESHYKAVNPITIVEETIQGMLNTRLIQSRDEIISTCYKSLEYGYPTPSLERDKALTKVIPELDKQHIYSRGRFGAWKYEVSNQDHSLMQGVEIINKLELNVNEITFPFPATANAMWGK
ncbi:MAG TPA: FAD-dependent oxidoreductase [Flavipsychrobacter sp.]|nr:FAD-dependent oxidoreductase [Flavipsychrobacter sp.]